MSLKLMLNCNGKLALHPTASPTVPVLMESPCPFTPWTWVLDEVGTSDDIVITSSNPGQSVTFRYDGPSGWYGRAWATTKVIWSCSHSGLTASATFAGSTNSAYVDLTNGFAYVVLEPGDAGPKAISGSGYYLRFGVRVIATSLRRGQSVTISFAWTT